MQRRPAGLVDVGAFLDELRRQGCSEIQGYFISRPKPAAELADFENTIKPGNLPALIYAAKVVRTPYLTPGGPDVTAVLVNGGVPAEPGAVVPLTASVTDTPSPPGGPSNCSRRCPRS